MNEFLKTVLSLSLSGTILILLLLWFRSLYKNRLSKRWQYYIWTIVIARLLIPFTPEVSLFGNMFQYYENRQVTREAEQGIPEGASGNYQTEKEQNSERNVLPAEADTGDKSPSTSELMSAGADTWDNVEGSSSSTSGLMSAGADKEGINPNEGYGEIAAGDETGKAAENTWLLKNGDMILNYLWLLWALPALILLVRKVTAYQCFVKYVRSGSREVCGLDILELLAEVCEEMGIKRHVGIYINGCVSSPMLAGIFRPFVVLPGTDMDKAQLYCILKHELIHCRKLDLLYKWLVQATICVHWFNPFVYLCGKEISRLCELACDEAMVREMDMEGRKRYGDTLVNALGVNTGFINNPATVTLSEGGEQLKERLGAIMSYKKRSKLCIAVSFVLSLAVSTGAVAAGAYAAPMYPQSKPGSSQTDSSQGSLASGSTKTSAALITVKPVNSLTDKDAAFVEIDDNSDSDWVNISSNSGEVYSYTQSGYYEEPYIFQLGWNLGDKGFPSYPHKAAVTLEDKTEITASFDDSCKSYATDKEVLASLGRLIDTLRADKSDPKIPLLEKPLVLNVTYVEKDKLEESAEIFYQEEQMLEFSAIFSKLSEKVQKKYGLRMLEDGRVAFWASVAGNMDFDKDMLSYFAEIAYEHDSISFFSVVGDMMTDKAKEKWIARCTADGRNTFRAVLRD